MEGTAWLALQGRTGLPNIEGTGLPCKVGNALIGLV
jgi:hypothetical protein